MCKVNEKVFQTPFDFAQGDCQTERSRSLFSRPKQHYVVILKNYKFCCSAGNFVMSI